MGNVACLIIWSGKDHGQGPYHLFDRVLTIQDLEFIKSQIEEIQRGEKKKETA